MPAREAGFAAMVARAAMQRTELTGNKGTLESVIALHFARMSATENLWKRESFTMLLLHLYGQRCFGLLRVPDFIEVLATMSCFGNKMVRDIAEWEACYAPPEEQLASLIRHCFAQYPVPEFMEHVFATGNKIHMLWYVQLGRGESVFALSVFPVKFTNKMSHYFRLTPAGYTVNQAIRGGKALGYGAAIERAEMLAWSTLADGFEHEAFWAGVIQFLCKADETVTMDKLQAVLAYVDNLRVNQPYMSMQGRTWAALLRQAEEWHTQQALRRCEEDRLYWPASGVEPLYIEKGDSVFAAVELTDSNVLYEEGEAMHHCVAEYDYDCYQGSSAIFSLREYQAGAEGFTRLATVEVCLANREVVQAKGKYNEFITDEVQALLKAWAESESLALTHEYDDGFYEPGVQPAPVPAQPEREQSWMWIKLVFWIVFCIMKMCGRQHRDSEYRIERMPDGSVTVEQVLR